MGLILEAATLAPSMGTALEDHNVDVQLRHGVHICVLTTGSGMALEVATLTSSLGMVSTRGHGKPWLNG